MLWGKLTFLKQKTTKVINLTNQCSSECMWSQQKMDRQMDDGHIESVTRV